MENRLYNQDNLNSLFSISNKQAFNDAGGVMLWTLPDRYQRAFNPQIVRADAWKFVTTTDSHEELQTPVRVSAVNGQVILSNPLPTRLVVFAEALHIDGDVYLSGVWRFDISAGTTAYSLPTGYAELTSIVGVAKTLGNTHSKSVVIDRQAVYIDGYKYTDDNFICDGAGAVLYKNISYKERVSFTLSTSTQSFPLSVEHNRGSALIDVSKVVSALFTGELTQMQEYVVWNAVIGGEETIRAVEDNRLFINYSLSFSAPISGTETYTYTAFNAVSQIGADDTIVAGVLNRLPIYKYDGYPAERSILSKDASIVIGDITTSPDSILRAEVATEETITDLNKEINIGYSGITNQFVYITYAKDSDRLIVEDMNGYSYTFDLSQEVQFTLTQNYTTTYIFDKYTLANVPMLRMRRTSGTIFQLNGVTQVSYYYDVARVALIQTANRPVLKWIISGKVVDNISVMRCTPQSPIYLRWVNTDGGVEQWMFSRRQTYKPAVKSSSTYEIDVLDYSTALTNRGVYALTAENKLVIGAEEVETTIYNELKKIPFSNEIEIFDKDRERWLRVYVDKYDGTYNTDTNKHSVEMTLSLPDLNLQF